MKKTCFLPASPWDYVTSTDKTGRLRFDPRKTFEFGSFVMTTIWGSLLVWRGTFTEFFFIGYMTAWTTARYLRDREQRMSRAKAKDENKPEGN